MVTNSEMATFESRLRGKPSPTSLCCFGIINVESNYLQNEGLEIDAEGRVSKPKAEKKHGILKCRRVSKNKFV